MSFFILASIILLLSIGGACGSSSPTIDDCQGQGEYICDTVQPGCFWLGFNHSITGSMSQRQTCVPSSWTQCSDITEYQFCFGAMLVWNNNNNNGNVSFP